MAKSNKIENKILKNIDLTENFLGKLLGQFFKPSEDKFLIRLRLLYNWLYTSESFRSQFIERAADIEKAHFNLERLDTVLNGIESDFKNEIEMDKKRWNGSFERWKRNIDKLRVNFIERRSYLRKQFKQYFKLSTTELDRIVPDFKE